jgi:ubiquinone/menaquinone biosynthesis C-methylase UbiE
MNPGEYDKMRRLEDEYWWFVGRRELALMLLRKHSNKRSGDVLDLGCGTGAVMASATEFSESVTGLDMSDRALEYAHQRELSGLTQADGTLLPFSDASFDAIVALDIFEHIEKDDLAFAEAYRVLRPGGILVLSVPAHRWLWSKHDVALHHFRRYTVREISQQLARARFEIETASYAVFLLFPLVVLSRLLERFRPGPAEASLPNVPSWLNRTLIHLLRLEGGWVLSGWRLPWGSSVVAIGRKPESVYSASRVGI